MSRVIVVMALLCGCGGGSAVAEQSAALTAEPQRYSYDAIGLPAAPKPAGRRFDALGRLEAVDDLTLRYGPDGQVASASRGQAEVGFVHDERGHRLAKRSGGQVVSAWFDDGTIVDDAGLHAPVRIAGRLVGLLHGARFEAVAADARGTITAGSTGAASLAAPHGARSLPGVIAELAHLVDFAGQPSDVDLGFVRMGAREYDPGSYRFTTPDPLLLEHPEMCVERPAECNLYGYAAGNPIDVIDPTGMAGEGADAKLGWSKEKVYMEQVAGPLRVKGLGAEVEAGLDVDKKTGLPTALELGARGYVYKVERDKGPWMLGGKDGNHVSVELTHTGPSAQVGVFGKDEKNRSFVGGEISAAKVELTVELCAFFCISATGEVGLTAGVHARAESGQLKIGAESGVFGIEVGAGVNPAQVQRAQESFVEAFVRWIRIPSLPMGGGY